MTRRALGRTFAALVLALLLAGCGGGATGQPDTSAGGTGAVLVAGTGGAVTVAMASVPTTLNPHTAAGDNPATDAVASMVWGQTFEPGQRLVPQLDPADSIVQSAEIVSVNPQTVVYTINPKALWSDGTEVSAQDFVYNWLAQSGTGHDIDGAPDSVAFTAGYSRISSVVGSDNGRTVTVVFASPYSDWPSLFDDLLPAHVGDKVGWNAGFDSYSSSTLISAGPWLITSWTPGKQIVLGRNPHWWGTPPVLRQITLQAVDGAPATVAALSGGRAEVGETSSPDVGLSAKLSSAPVLQSQIELGTTMLELVFNTRVSPLDTVATRLGIAHLVDRAGIVDDVVKPLAPSASQDNDHLFVNLQQWYHDDAAGFESVDPIAASDDLLNAGLAMGPDGTWASRGVPLTLRLAWASDDPWSAAVGPVVSAELVAAGFDVATDPVPQATLLGGVLPQGKFDLALAPQPAVPYPSVLASAFGVGPAGVTVANMPDWSGFDDPKTDRLFAQASQQLAADEQQQLYQQIDANLWSTMPTLPLFAEPTTLMWNATLQFVPDGTTPLGPLAGAALWTRLVPAPVSKAP